MSKLSDFQTAKHVADRLRRDADYALGRDSGNNDKAEFSAKYLSRSIGQFSPMQFEVHALHGYYGSSSCSSDTSDDLGRYLARAITKHGAMLLDYAVKLAQEDAEAARKAAEAEAREVLRETVTP